MGLLGALFERFHSPNPEKAKLVARAAFMFYWQLQKADLKINDGIRVFLSCYLALEAIPADGDAVASSEQLAAASTFRDDGTCSNIACAATVTAAGRGHMLNKQTDYDLNDLAKEYWETLAPAWKREYDASGLPSELFSTYTSRHYKVEQLVAQLTGPR